MRGRQPVSGGAGVPPQSATSLTHVAYHHHDHSLPAVAVEGGGQAGPSERALSLASLALLWMGRSMCEGRGGGRGRPETRESKRKVTDSKLEKPGSSACRKCPRNDGVCVISLSSPRLLLPFTCPRRPSTTLLLTSTHPHPLYPTQTPIRLLSPHRLTDPQAITHTRLADGSAPYYLTMTHHGSPLPYSHYYPTHTAAL